MLLGVSDDHLTEYMQAVALSGKQYGMEFHWGKFQLLGVQCEPDIRLPDNSQVQVGNSLTYLGTVLTPDGKHGHELSRRIGLEKLTLSHYSKSGSVHPFTGDGKFVSIQL